MTECLCHLTTLFQLQRLCGHTRVRPRKPKIIASNLVEIQQLQSTRPHSSCISLLPWDKNGRDTYICYTYSLNICLQKLWRTERNLIEMADPSVNGRSEKRKWMYGVIVSIRLPGKVCVNEPLCNETLPFSSHSIQQFKIICTSPIIIISEEIWGLHMETINIHPQKANLTLF